MKGDPDRFPHTRGGEPWTPLAAVPIVSGFPHTRGGEPYASGFGFVVSGVFPTHVGVNRCIANGDALTQVFSPHTWG